jgi:adenosylcobinamide amidohydrolase
MAGIASTEITDLGFTTSGKHLFHVKATISAEGTMGTSIAVPCYQIHAIVPGECTDVATIGAVTGNTIALTLPDPLGEGGTVNILVIGT